MFFLYFSQEESKRAEYTLHGCLNDSAKEAEPLKVISALSRTMEKSYRYANNTHARTYAHTHIYTCTHTRLLE